MYIQALYKSNNDMVKPSFEFLSVNYDYFANEATQKKVLNIKLIVKI